MTYQNISLNTTHSARNLGFIFDENLTFSDQISSLSIYIGPATITFVNCAAFAHILSKDSQHHRHLYGTFQT